jgi:hypothetical protein
MLGINVYGGQFKKYKELLFSCKNKLNDLAKKFGKKINKKNVIHFDPRK